MRRFHRRRLRVRSQQPNSSGWMQSDRLPTPRTSISGDSPMPVMTGLSGNDMFCLALKGLSAGDLVIGNSVYSLGFVGGIGAGFKAAFGGEVSQLSQIDQSGAEKPQRLIVHHPHGPGGPAPWPRRRWRRITGVTSGRAASTFQRQTSNSCRSLPRSMPPTRASRAAYSPPAATARNCIASSTLITFHCNSCSATSPIPRAWPADCWVA